MGFAKIISGGEDGRYTIELDFGKALRDAALPYLADRANKIQIDIGSTLAKIAAAEVEIQTMRDDHAAAVADYIEAAEYLRMNGTLPPGVPELSTKAIDAIASLIRRAVATSDPLRRVLDAHRFALKAVNVDIARWTNIVATSTRQAWCTTLTEDGPAGAFVATVDIPGDSSLVLIAPECRAWQPSDGYLRARAMMSPEQAFWNAAVQPGWQKFKPTYRWGTATAINYDDNTMTVALFDQKSSVRQLPINQASVLVGVPVTYMNCDARAFEIDDRVVVQFEAQDWSNPRVIGFLDNPRGCFNWKLVASIFSDLGPTLKNQSFSSSFTGSTETWAEWVAEAGANTLQLRIRMDGGGWTDYDYTTLYGGGFIAFAEAPSQYAATVLNFHISGSDMLVSASVNISPTGTQPFTPHTSDAIFEFLALRQDGSVIYNSAFRVTADASANEFKQYRSISPLLPGSYDSELGGVPSELPGYTLYSETL